MIFMYSGTKFLFRSLLFFSFTWLLIRYLFPFLLPFLLGTGLALSAEPLVRPLCRKLHLPRSLGAGIGVACTFLLFGTLIISLVTLLLRGLSPLSRILPALAETASSGLLVLKSWLLQQISRAPQSVRPFLRQHVTSFFSDSTSFLQQALGYALSLAGGVLTHIPGQAFTLLTSVISGFMISAKLPGLKETLQEKISKQSLAAIAGFLRRLKGTAGHWLLAELKLTGITLLILTGGFVLLKIPYAPIWALFIALLDALPLLGTGAVLIPWSIISLLQADRVRALGLLAIYICALLTRSLLEPRLVGRQLGLDPLVTLASMYAGYSLWGFGGLILSPLLTVTAFGLFGPSADEGKNM